MRQKSADLGQSQKQIFPVEVTSAPSFTETMFARLVYLDYITFQRINRDWTNSILDYLMPILTDLHKVPGIVYGVLPVVLLLWVRAERWRAARAIAGLALVLALSDSGTHMLIKPIFERGRPETVGLAPILRTDSHSGFSFPSNHATNAFAAASYLTFYYPGYTFQYLFAASTIAYSRVYVGVHFPSDVLGGAILGWLIGAFFRYLWKFIEFKAISVERTREIEEADSRRQLRG